MILFFEIPLVLIIFILLGLIGIGVQIASTVLFWIFIILFLIYWIIFGIGLVSSGIIKDSVMGIVMAVIACILGFLISLFLVQSFYRVDNGIKTLFLVLAGFVIAQVIIILVSNSAENSKVVHFLCVMMTFVLSAVCCMWTIGYHLSFPVKTTVGNAAYYECVEHKTKPGVMPYINRNIYDSYSINIKNMSDDQIIGSYQVGDRLRPAGGKKYLGKSTIFQTVHTPTWYSVYTDDGQIGWIPPREIEIYYYRQSESIRERQEEILENNWYGHLPKFMIEWSESFFERHPHQFKCNFAEDY